MLVTICAFSLTACGKKEETAAYQQITDDMISNCAEVSQSAVESLAGFDDETLEQMTANRDTFTRLAVDAWMDQENELGKYEEMGTPTTDVDREEGQITVDIPAKFEKGDAEIKVVFNYSSDYDQMVPAYMTISEVETTGMKLNGAAVSNAKIKIYKIVQENSSLAANPSVENSSAHSININAPITTSIGAIVTTIL